MAGSPTPREGHPEHLTTGVPAHSSPAERTAGRSRFRPVGLAISCHTRCPLVEEGPGKKILGCLGSRRTQRGDGPAPARAIGKCSPDGRGGSSKAQFSSADSLSASVSRWLPTAKPHVCRHTRKQNIRAQKRKRKNSGITCVTVRSMYDISGV